MVQSFSAKDLVSRHSMNLTIAETRVAYIFNILGLVPTSDRYIDDGSLCTLSSNLVGSEQEYQ